MGEGLMPSSHTHHTCARTSRIPLPSDSRSLALGNSFPEHGEARSHQCCSLLHPPGTAACPASRGGKAITRVWIVIAHRLSLQLRVWNAAFAAACWTQDYHSAVGGGSHAFTSWTIWLSIASSASSSSSIASIGFPEEVSIWMMAFLFAFVWHWRCWKIHCCMAVR